MANVSNVRGLRALTAGIAGTAPRVTEYTLATSTTCYEGAIVVLQTDGTVKPSTMTGTTTVLTAIGNIVGAAANYIKNSASDTGKVMVYDDPQQRFVVDTGTLTTLKAAELGKFAYLANNTTGNTTTLQSKAALSVVTVTAAYGIVRFAGIFTIPGDVATTSHRDVVVQFNPAKHVWSNQGVAAI